MDGMHDDRGGDRRYREERQPFPDHLRIATPPVGAGFTFDLDSTWEWRVVALSFDLTTSAIVGSRYAFLDVCDHEGTAWFQSFFGHPIPENATSRMWFMSTYNLSDYTDDQKRFETDFPNVWIPGGWQLRGGLVDQDAGDAISGIRLYAEKRLS